MDNENNGAKTVHLRLTGEHTRALLALKEALKDDIRLRSAGRLSLTTVARLALLTGLAALEGEIKEKATGGS